MHLIISNLTKILNVVTTTTNSIKILNGGIVLNKLNTRSGFKKVYQLESKYAINHLNNGVKAPLIFDVSKIDNITFDEVRSILSKDSTSFCSSLAIVINSTIYLSIMNLWLSISKPECPIHFFENKDDALAWIKK